MKVIEHLANAKKTLISFEIIPPKRGGHIKQLLAVLEEIVKYNPPFIDITSHAAEVAYDETSNGQFEVRIKRKRPGTLGICALIQNKYNIDAVPHVICHGFTKEETEDFLIELHYLGIDNVLAVRGDESNYHKPIKFGRTVNIYAADLVRQVSNINSGKYLENYLIDAERMDFCIGVGGYPEKHFEAPNLLTDIKYTKRKIDAGADYLVTQLFYDNKNFYNYEKLCRENGIEVPIIPGIKIITSKSQVSNLPKNFHVDIPNELSDEILEADEKHIIDIGVEWAYKQVVDLLNNNVPAIHFYIMQNSGPVKKLMTKLNL